MLTDLACRVTSRIEWGCPDGAESPTWPAALHRPAHLMVHHTAIRLAGEASADAVRAIWRLHAIDRGWGDVGYHYLVAPDGGIFEGRAGGPGVVGGHFIGGNHGTIGVALLGNFMVEPVSEAAVSALIELTAALGAAFGIDPGRDAHPGPGGRLLPSLCGHRDGNPSTECPGDHLYARLADVRRAAAAMIRERR
ncbi:MAG TPA: peptidoglycan recognition family protein [Vicinamibacterales bacterium]|nr:peptidoglycan recognition family protein [Vicinamibacterales bacterium]